MTINRKMVVGIEDITSLILECNDCKTRVSHSPAKIDFPKKCPNPGCNHPWLPSRAIDKNQPAFPAAVSLVRSIKEIAQEHTGEIIRAGEEVGFTVMFEFIPTDHLES